MSVCANRLTPREVFLAAARIAPAAWPEYLDRACGDDAPLRARVQELLEAHLAAGSFLQTPAEAAFAPTIAEPQLPDVGGAQIGPYKLLQQIGEGGMGAVYMAEQTHPVHRKVAIKLVKPGLDNRQVIARFEAERQALALMDHPNIAQVFDGGTTASGRPYFVMELVKGIPITEYCDRYQVAPRERLELFVTVCQAVQHAHQKGIIHRDIKPTNILITLHDDKPVVKVIDFGIAKATCGPLTDKTLFTGFAQLVGTPLYMSPEQTALSGLDVDTRSDVYSLGVLLYELLTGTTPFDKSRLANAGYDEIRQIIREEEPLRPSARITTLRNAQTTPTARHRGQPSPAAFGELDWIVMKALEKDRNRRYESASGLARDLERYLRDEPVQACPPSHWYRFRKLARRNRTACWAVAAAVAVLLFGTAALGVSNYLIRQEQARTQVEQQRTGQALRLAEQRAEEIRQGLERLKQANTLIERGRWYTYSRRWDDAHDLFTQAVELRKDLVSGWVVRSDLYTQVGLWDRAAADYARELELRGPETTFRWLLHALLRHAVGDDEGCRQVAREMRRRFAGTLEIHFIEEILRSSLLVPDADADLRQLVELARQAAPDRSESLYFVVGHADYRAGRYAEAVQTLKDALARPHAPIGEATSPVLAMAYQRLGRDADARQTLDEAARVLDRWTQERHAGQPGVWVVDQGASGYWPVGWWDYLECQLLYREARLLIDGVPPPDDPRLHVLRARALAALQWGQQAIPEYELALQLNPHDSQARMELHRIRGRCCVDRGQWREAAAEFDAAAKIKPEDADLARFQAVAHFAAGDVDAYRQVCATMLERFGQTQDRRTAVNVLLVCVLQDDVLSDMGRLQPLARVPTWHGGDWTRGAALYRVGRLEESVECFEASARKFRPRALDWCFLAMAHHRLGHADDARRCLAEARRWIDAATHASADLSSVQPAWGGWYEKVVFPRLLQEAEMLLNHKSEDRRRKSKDGDP